MKPLGLGECEEKSRGISKRETLAANTSPHGTHRDGRKKGNKEREQMETEGDVKEEDYRMSDALQDVKRVKQKKRGDIGEKRARKDRVKERKEE